MFEVVALNVSSYLHDFEKADKKTKQLQLALLKQAIEDNPESMQRILSDVLGMSREKQDELAELLEHTTLSSIISAAKLVADRLLFLKGLEAMIFDETLRDRMLERSQLHRILVDHTWIFGEEYHITVDDESLTHLLEQHAHLLGRSRFETEDEQTPSAPKRGRRPKIASVKLADGGDGIVDLGLCRAVSQHNGAEREHLVIELKRPKKVIDLEVAGQISRYANAVEKDSRFRDTKTRWRFWAIGHAIHDDVRFQIKGRGGLYVGQPGDSMQVWIKSWGEILQEAEGRMQFYKRQLNYSATRETALAALRKTHGKYFPTRPEKADSGDVKSSGG